MNGRILIVEDDPALAELVKDGLKAAGFTAAVAAHGEEALQAVRNRPPDLVILDIRLGGISGLQVCEVLRKNPATAGIPILMLTSMGQEKDKVAGLRLGADDYVTKPFSEPELVARVEALLRRARRPGSDENVQRLGTLALNPERREVILAGKPVDLTTLEFDLLLYFLEHPGRAVTYDTLAGEVWREARVATPHTITVMVSRLREKLKAWGKRIEPVRGLGYRLSDRD